MARQPGALDVERISLRLGRDQLARIAEKAAAARTSQAAIVRQLVQAALDAEEAAEQQQAPARKAS